MLSTVDPPVELPSIPEEPHVPRERFRFLRHFLKFEYRNKEKAPRRKTFKVLRIIACSILAAIALSVALVMCFRWVPPPTSAVMLERRVANLFCEEPRTATCYQWVDWESISPHLLLAVVAAEDQKFPDHRGFDLEAISEVLEKRKNADRMRGASTITQQVAKNLFLWSGRSYVRKGLEAYFTVLLEMLWPKRRILEVYVNIAEFGEGTYGVWAASKTLLKKDPASLTREDAALLAAVLPNPRRFKVTHPSSYVAYRQYWIERQMEQLGGAEYLRNL